MKTLPLKKYLSTARYSFTNYLTRDCIYPFYASFTGSTLKIHRGHPVGMSKIHWSKAEGMDKIIGYVNPFQGFFQLIIILPHNAFVR